MSDLAYNLNGESFEVPATAAGWRVRRISSAVPRKHAQLTPIDHLMNAARRKTL